MSLVIFLAEGTAAAVDCVASFAKALRQSRLLEPGQLAELTGKLLARFGEPRALAAELIRRGWLTPYQVNQLFQGRGDELLLGSYVLLERLGEGGMGQVFKARNWKLRKIVAVKLIRKDRLANPEAVRRFQREVRAAAQLNHPNVVHAIDTDQIDGRLFFVMEYIEGTDLSKRVQQYGPLPVAQACDCVRQAALGLQHAFERGLVHRDIKPHNLLLAMGSAGHHPPAAPTGDVVKILDMGLARLSGSAEESESSSTMTREGTVMGTLDYIAPEQALDAHKADTRSDLYSLGCTLFFLLTGRPPFPGGTATEKLLKHQLEEPTPIEQLRPDVPADVSAIVRKLMAKRPEERYQTPAEAATALAAALSGASIAVVAADQATVSFPPEERPVPAGPVGQSMMDTAADWSSIVAQPAAPRPDAVWELRRTAQRRWMWFNIAGGAALLALVGLLAALLRGRTVPTNDTPPTIAKHETVKESEAQAFEKWLKKVARQSPDWQIKAVAGKLKERNRGFDGILKPTIENEIVVGLEFNGDHVTDLNPLRALTGLKRLRCASDAGLSPLVDLSPLKGLPLIHLDCHGTKVADLSPLKGMPLTSLDCRSTPVRDLAILSGMPLTSLVLENTRITDLSSLKGMRLVELRCGGTEVADLSPLKGMPLTSLSCNHTKVRDLLPLEGMPLVSLHCENMRVADLSPLKKLRLVELRCSNTDIVSLAPLHDMRLERLSCANTRVADLMPLRGMRLVELNCARTQVADLSPLKGMPLIYLHCAEAKVTDLSPLKGLPLRELACDFQPKRDEDILRSLTTLERINGQPAAEFWKRVRP